METILGLAMLYAWIHGVIIVAKKTTGTTTYENSVLIAALVAFILYLAGSMM